MTKEKVEAEKVEMIRRYCRERFDARGVQVSKYDKHLKCFKVQMIILVPHTHTQFVYIPEGDLQEYERRLKNGNMA